MAARAVRISYDQVGGISLALPDQASEARDCKVCCVSHARRLAATLDSVILGAMVAQRWQRLAVLTGIAAAFVLAYALRDLVPLGKTVEAVRGFVSDAGWWGPPVFVVLFAFRSVFLIPSIVLLTAGGICFGVLGGTIFGAAGLTFSAVLKLFVAHVAGREKLRARLSRRVRDKLALLDGKVGAGTLGMVTAYPVGPAEALHIAAILAGMGALPFVLSVSAGSLVRAGSLSLFGEALVAGRGLVLAVAVLSAAALVPAAVLWRVRR
jgi:uncharacterized membrane protein YdjX (TVP38/TMEM64 family)